MALEPSTGAGTGGFTKDGKYIYTLLHEIGINFETKDLVIKAVDDTVELITSGMRTTIL